MKTRIQKEEELKEAKTLLGKSKVLVLADFSKITAEDLRQLRREMKAAKANLLVIKKRLLNVLFKEAGVDYDARQFTGSVGAIFSENSLENVSGPIFKFFSALGGTDKDAKAVAIKKILGGDNFATKEVINSETLLM